MLDRIKNIFYRPEFFRRQEFTAGQALSFYSLAVLFLTLGISLVVITTMWGMQHFFDSAEWRDVRSTIEGMYPDDLVLSFENGKLLTNQAGPVVIPFPEEWRAKECEKRSCADAPKNFLVIDRTVDLSPRAIAEHDTIILANETEIGMHSDERGETRIAAFTELGKNESFQVNKAQYLVWVEKGIEIVRTALWVLMAIIPFVLYIGLWVGHIIYTLFGALVVWLAATIRNQKLTYGRAYFSALYLLPASFVLMLMLTAFDARMPFLFTLVLFVMALVNFQPEVTSVASAGGSVMLPNAEPATPARPTEEKPAA